MNKPIKNKKFRKLMQQAGLEGIELIKGDGYFYISSQNPKWDEIIYKLPEIVIYMADFNQQTPKQWVEIINYLIIKYFI